MAVRDVRFSPGVKKDERASTKHFRLFAKFSGSNLKSLGMLSRALFLDPGVSTLVSLLFPDCSVSLPLASLSMSTRPSALGKSDPFCGPSNP